ncbi:MAG: tetratricopeptide repeat protein [Acetobacteraceae bacterium]
MVDIFDEINEELRAEKAQRLLKQYGGLIFAACLLVIAAVAGWQGWKYWQARQDLAAANAYLTTLNAVESAPADNAAARAAASKGFDALATQAPEGYRTLAQLQAAAAQAAAGNLKEAATLWDQVAADSAADPLLRDLASLLWASHQIDNGDPALLQARLKPLTTPGNAWRSLAQEQLALLDLRQGHQDEARTAFRKLAEDVTAPSGVRGRASAMLAQLGG